MIRRHDSASLAPVCLGDDPATRAAKERVKAAAHYATVPPPTKAYPFEVYKDDAVKAALAELFAEKCAYCEFRLDGAPFDIEHYRPKGGVVEDDGSESGGYWWLASTWSNLLPACQDCNRARYHALPSGGEVKFGKENMFPLLGTPRATCPGGEAGEHPALLNPTIDDPREHYVFRIEPQPDGSDGSIAAARIQPDGTADPRALGTNRVVGLNRPRLVRARMAHITGLRLALRSIEKEWALYRRAATQQARDDAVANIRRETKDVWAQYLSWRSMYSAACRAEYARWAKAIAAQVTA